MAHKQQKQLGLDVLRAALRCARHRRAADHAALLVRIDCTREALDEALARLEAAGLVIVTARQVRLTLEGFAIAVASVGRATAAPARVRTAA